MHSTQPANATHPATSAATLLITGLVFVASGCRIGGSGASFENENDKLRAERLMLQREVDDLKDALALREEELDALRHAEARRTRDGGAGDGQIATWSRGPVLSRVEIGDLSGPIDTDGDEANGPEEFRVYLKTFDQHGRFLPAAASAVVQLVRIDPRPAPDGTLTSLARVEFDADAFKQAYRSNFTGTHFALSLPFPDAPDNAEPGEITIKVTLTDEATGNALEASSHKAIARAD